MRTIEKLALATFALGLAGCQQEPTHKMATANHYDYTAAFARCVPSDSDDKTLAEHEHDCARKFYEEKKDEMNDLFSQVSAIYEEHLQDHPTQLTKTQFEKLMDSQEQFVKFVKKISKRSNASFVKDYPYHYYGTMTDYINVRLRHLQNLKKELANS